MNNLTSWIFEYTENSEKIAVRHKDEEISYKDLYKKIKSASSLFRREIGESKNVILISDNSLFFIISYFAIIGSGNVCVPLKYDKNMHLLELKEKVECRSIVLQKKFEDIVNGVGFENIISEDRLDEISEDFEFNKYKKEKLAAIMFTSGTTSEAKGVKISHNNIIKNSKSIINGLFLNEDDRILVVLPFYYCFGASLLHTHLRAGADLVLNNEFFIPQRIVNDLRDKECTGIAGVPTTFQMILRRTNIKNMKLPKIRCIQQAGGKLTNSFLKELGKIFGYEKIFVMYGQTEGTARLSILNPKYLPEKLGSIGKGLIGTELKILNRDLKDVGVFEAGEVYAKGENIMLGYYKDTESSNKKLVNEMLRTGDIAHLDDEGFIYILDRQTDFIKTRGYRVSSKRVEEVILEIPEIVEVAVIGISDDIYGERIVAFISKEKNVDKKRILEHCSIKLQSHELPIEVVILKELPKNKSLKIDYVKLKRDYSLLNEDV